MDHWTASAPCSFSSMKWAPRASSLTPPASFWITRRNRTGPAHLCFGAQRQAQRSHVEAWVVRHRQREAPSPPSPAAASSTPLSRPSPPSATPAHPSESGEELSVFLTDEGGSQHSRSRRNWSSCRLPLGRLKAAAASSLLRSSNTVICSRRNSRTPSVSNFHSFCRSPGRSGRVCCVYALVIPCPPVAPPVSSAAVPSMRITTTIMEAILAVSRRLPGLQLARCWWSRLRQDVRRFLRACAFCLAISDSPSKWKSNLPIGTPFERGATEFFGPLPQTKSGNNHIFVFIDQRARWVELVELLTPQQPWWPEPFSTHGSAAGGCHCLAPFCQTAGRTLQQNFSSSSARPPALTSSPQPLVIRQRIAEKNRSFSKTLLVASRNACSAAYALRLKNFRNMGKFSPAFRGPFVAKTVRPCGLKAELFDPVSGTEVFKGCTCFSRCLSNAASACRGLLTWAKTIVHAGRADQQGPLQAAAAASEPQLGDVAASSSGRQSHPGRPRESSGAPTFALCVHVYSVLCVDLLPDVSRLPGIRSLASSSLRSLPLAFFRLQETALFLTRVHAYLCPPLSSLALSMLSPSAPALAAAFWVPRWHIDEPCGLAFADSGAARPALRGLRTIPHSSSPPAYSVHLGLRSLGKVRAGP
ncbi:hypothetical protein Efla_000505 [Eimeria flavescens]